MDTDNASKLMESIDVDVPVSTAYDQWTQFEEFPRFMEDVDSVRQLDDETLHWKVTLGGVTKEWTSRITEQTPDKRIAWTNLDGAPNAGVVTFHRLSNTSSRVALQLDYAPEGVVEIVGDALGVVARRTRGDLARFKKFIEERQVASGAFRGKIAPPGER